MGDVVEIPGFDQRRWTKNEAAIIVELLSEGFSVEAADWIRAEWKRRMLAAGATFKKSWSAPVPPGVSPEGVEFTRAAAKAVEDLFEKERLGLGTQLLLAVVELYAAKFGGAPPPTKLAEVLTFSWRPAGLSDDKKRED